MLYCSPPPPRVSAWPKLRLTYIITFLPILWLDREASLACALGSRVHGSFGLQALG